MLAIQKVGWLRRDEELATIGIRTRVCLELIMLAYHAQKTGGIMFHQEVFVIELVAIDAEAAGAVGVEEVAALAHKVLDHTVENRAFVSHGLMVESG